MIIYPIIFLISTILLHYGYKFEMKEKIYQGAVLYVLALALPAFLAGLRSLEIGTDIKTYVEPLYKIAEHNNIFRYYCNSFVSNFYRTNVANVEPGYSLLIFVCAKIFPTINGALFISHSFILFFVFMGIKKIDFGYDYAFPMLVFYLLFYNETLNMVRQSMALALIFYGFNYIIKGNYKKYIFICVFAILFHVSAVIGVFILLFYIFYYWQGKRWKSVLIITILLLCLSFWEDLVQFLISFGLIPSRYIHYVFGDVDMWKLRNTTIIKIPILLIGLVYYKTLKRKNSEYTFLTLLAVFDILFAQLKNIQVYAYRIGLYFTYIKIHYYTLILCGSSFRWNRSITKIGVFLGLIIYWYYNYVFLGYNETVPYKFYFENNF